MTFYYIILLKLNLLKENILTNKQRNPIYFKGDLLKARQIYNSMKSSMSPTMRQIKTGIEIILI